MWNKSVTSNRSSGILTSRAKMKNKVLAAVGVVAMAATTSLWGAQPASASLCVPRDYNIVWDGWTGTLRLCFSNGDGSWLQQGTTRHRVTYTQGTTQTGYAHRIRMRVDFNNTPSNSVDDQLFDGYFFTQGTSSLRDIAGVTYWNGIPFGFFADRVR